MVQVPMRFSKLPLRPISRAILISGVLALSALSSAAEGGFAATLSIQQKDTAGLTLLTRAEREVLDRLVAIEVTEARRDPQAKPEGTFASRLTDSERKQAGLDRLTPDQLNKLNGLVANAVGSAPKPKERPRIRDSDVFTARQKPEVHGGMSLTYGRASGGGDFRSASMWVDFFDPNTGLGIGIGLSRSSGRGAFGYFPGDYYDSPFGYSPVFGYDGYPLGGFGSLSRTGWYGPDSESFRLSGDWNSSTYRGFRHH